MTMIYNRYKYYNRYILLSKAEAPVDSLLRFFWSPSVASGQGRLGTIHSESAGDDKGKKKKNFVWDIKFSSK